MGPGTHINPEAKICPQCGRHSPLTTQACASCGHVFRSNFQAAAPPPQYAQSPGPNPTQAFYGSNQPAVPQSAQSLAEYARQFNESKKLLLLTFWIGLFCLWPLWIVTYIEYTKMRNIKDEVARTGVDVRWWQLTYRAHDAF